MSSFTLLNVHLLVLLAAANSKRAMGYLDMNLLTLANVSMGVARVGSVLQLHTW